MSRLLVPASNPYRTIDDALARADAHLARARAHFDGGSHATARVLGNKAMGEVGRPRVLSHADDVPRAAGADMPVARAVGMGGRK